VNVYEDIELWGVVNSGVENYLNLRCGHFWKVSIRHLEFKGWIVIDDGGVYKS
jgi:hypothetical protein